MKYILGGIGLFFSLFFGTGLILVMFSSESEINDHIYNAIRDGLLFIATLLCLIFSIVIMLLAKIAVELHKINSES